MLGVALEGGGARGAFHVGAIKALLEEGRIVPGNFVYLTDIMYNQVNCSVC